MTTFVWKTGVFWTNALALALTWALLTGCGSEPTESGEDCPLNCPAGTMCNVELISCVPVDDDSGQADVAADMGQDLESPDAGRDATADEADVAEDVAGSNDAAGDVPDEDTAEPDTSEDTEEVREDVALDLADATDAADSLDEEVVVYTAPDPVQQLAAAVAPPAGARLTWFVPDVDQVTGYRITRDGELVIELAIPLLDTFLVGGIDPGSTVDLGVQSFVDTPEGRLYSEALEVTASVPLPGSLLVTPMTGVVLASPALTGTGQAELLHVSVYYPDGQPIWAPLISGGRKRASALVGFSSTNESVATVSALGVIQAVGAGVAEIDVEFSWTGGRTSDSVLVEVVDSLSKALVEVSLRAVPVEVEEDEEPIVTQLGAQMLGPNEVSFQLTDGASINMLLYGGTHHLIVSEPDGRVRRQAIHVRPGQSIRVGQYWSRDQTCVELGPAGGVINAPDGAALRVPAGALSQVQAVCLSAMPPAEAPRRGPSTEAPLLAPVAYEVTASDTTFGETVTLAMPVDPDLADWVRSTAGSSPVVPLFKYELVQWEGHGRARLEADSRDALHASITAPGQFSAQLCPGLGDVSGACRVVRESCAGSQRVVQDEATGGTCGDIVDIETSVLMDVQETTKSTDGLDADLTAPAARAFGLMAGLGEIGTACRAHPCGSGESCPETCRATATTHTCGRTYSGRLERHGASEWLTVRRFEVHVPVRPGCGDEFETCSPDAVCLSGGVDACVAECLNGE